jgi:signal transduction histidine kinase
MRPVLPRSLYGQLLVSQLVLLALLAILLPALMQVVLDRAANDLVEGRLRYDADILALTLRQPAAEVRSAALRKLGPLYSDQWGSRAFRVTDAGGRVIVEGGMPSAMLPRAPSASGVEQFAHLARVDVYRRPIGVEGRPAVLEIAQDRSRPEVIVDDVVVAFWRRMIWVVLLSFAASILLGQFILRRVTRQLRRVSEEADDIRPDTLGVRLKTAHLPLEVKNLAEATNRAFDRVAAGYQLQREFVANVAHELRTPITLLALRCDALPESPERASLYDAIDRATHVIAQLMDLAAIEQRTAQVDSFTMDAVAREAVERSVPLVYRSGRSIEVEEPA